jgi:Recombination endonuclease VII
MAKQVSVLTHERVLELFDYEEDTGNLLWKKLTTNCRRVGDIVGCVATNGRRYTKVDGENQMVHRLVWFFHKGAWPQYNLAPIDGGYLNTRLGNLVEQTPRETIKKVGLRSSNKTGVKGISWDAIRKEYAVFAYINGKSIFHSSHKTIDEDALAAAKEAEQGIIPTQEQRRIAHERKIARKRLWAKMIKWCKGLHRWESVEQFLKIVGDPPHEDSRLVPADNMLALGPDNFRWTTVGEDHRSDIAKQKAKEREGNQERYRDGHLRRKFKSSHKVYVEKLLEQKGVCANCGNPETRADKNGRISEFQVDHNHATGKLRGLLCFACNTGLGQFRDSPDLLRKAANYLEKWAEIHATEGKEHTNGTMDRT